MKPTLSQPQREQIKSYIKNRIDIAPLIENFSIANEDLTGAIISRINRPDENISGVILASTTIGEEGKVNNLNRVIAKGCNFRGSIWKGETWFRRACLSNTSFKDCFCPYIDMRKADLRGVDFCGMVIQVLTPRTMDILVSPEMHNEIAKHLKLDTIPKP